MSKVQLHPVCRDAHGAVHIVTTIGHKHVTCVVLGWPVSVVQLPVNDHGLVPLMFAGQPYPVKRAKRSFLAIGRERGITKAAKEALQRLQ